MKEDCGSFWKIGGEREVCKDTAAGKREYERRKVEMCFRQDFICPWCQQVMLPSTTTFGHQVPRGMGGGTRDDRTMIGDEWLNCAMHYACNGLQGSRRYSWQSGRYLPVVKG